MTFPDLIQQITWLNAGISALQIATVLPAVKDLQVIKSITLNDMSLVFSDDKPFAPLTSSTDTSATFGLPFAFPLDIVALQETITIGFKGTNMATLALPKGAAVTNVETRTLKTTFSNVPFAVIAGQEAVFQDFLKGATTSASQTFHMSGSANTDAQTAIGLLSISDIPFSLDTTIAGVFLSPNVTHYYCLRSCQPSTASVEAPSSLTSRSRVVVERTETSSLSHR